MDKYNFTQKEIDKFLSKIDKKGEDECWEFSHRNNKYSISMHYFYRKGQNLRVVSTRMAYYILCGIDPGDKVVRHTCANFACCNPKHMTLTTRKGSIPFHVKDTETGTYVKVSRERHFSGNAEQDIPKFKKLIEEEGYCLPIDFREGTILDGVGRTPYPYILQVLTEMLNQGILEQRVIGVSNTYKKNSSALDLFGSNYVQKVYGYFVKDETAFYKSKAEGRYYRHQLYWSF